MREQFEKARRRKYKPKGTSFFLKADTFLEKRRITFANDHDRIAGASLMGEFAEDEVRAAVAAERELCRICGHEWSRHDPEDGRCDAGPPCKCGRDLEWMQKVIAELSRGSLAIRDGGKNAD